MSTDFKSADQKLKDIISKSKDVDPDLRFMALNDLNKLLVEHNLIINKVNSYSSKIVALLLDGLNDTNSDVQNQSLKCFKHLVSNLDDNEILSILEELNKTQISDNLITTSIHTMAVSEILKNVNLKHSSTGELIVAKLSPSLIQEGVVVQSLDAIETLSDLIKNLGNTMSAEQLSFIYLALINTIYSKGNTKCIAALGYLVNYLSKEEINSVFNTISQKSTNDIENTTITLNIYNTLARNDTTLFESYIDGVLSYAVEKLDLESEEIQDDQVKIDDIRTEALRLISLLIPIGERVIDQEAVFLQAIQYFINYSPYTNDDDEDGDEDMDDFSDPEFSDEEEFDDVDDADDNSWKLRKQAADLLGALSTSFPYQILPKIYEDGLFDKLLNGLGDSSEAVSFAKIESLTAIVKTTNKDEAFRSLHNDRPDDRPWSYLSARRSEVVKKVSKELSSATQVSKFNTLLHFFDELKDLKLDLKVVLSTIRENNFGLNLDLLQFYSTTFKQNDIAYFEDELEYIACVIDGGLKSMNHISVLNSIDTTADYLNLTFDERLATSLLEILKNTKNDSEVRNQAVLAFSGVETLEPHFVSDVWTALESTLDYEPLVINAIHALSTLTVKYAEILSQGNISNVVQRFKSLLKDPKYASEVVEALTTMARYVAIDSSIASILCELFENNLYQSHILKTLSRLDLDKNQLKEIFYKAYTIDEIDDEALLDVSKRIGSQLIPTLEQHPDDSRLIKILANIIIEEGLEDYVKARKAELLQRVNTNFNVRLLGYVGEKADAPLTIDEIVELFDIDETKIYAAQTLGKLVTRNYSFHIPNFLTKIRNDEHRYLLLISVKSVLSINHEIDEQTYSDIWETLISILSAGDDIDDGIDDDVSKIAAQVLGLILAYNKSKEHFYHKALEALRSDSRSIIYTIIAAIKFILTYENIVSQELTESLLLESFKKISDKNLKIKQIAIVTLITALNNHFILLKDYLPNILPNIYEELAAKKEYQETLQIGPFKHKVDKAIEVRKNSFEFLYKLSVNHNGLKNVDFNEILSVVVKNGLVIDIISISSLIIIKLLEFDDVVLSTDDKKVLGDGIDKMLVNIKKKEDQQKDSKEEQETKTILINLRNHIFHQ